MAVVYNKETDGVTKQTKNKSDTTTNTTRFFIITIVNPHFHLPQ